jgi:hypothetical protein
MTTVQRTFALVACAALLGLFSACASGRVRGGQGTEMQQEQAYDPSNAAKPPTGNTDFSSGPIKSITPPPVLEVDLERRRRPYEPATDPEPQPQSESNSENEPE